MSALLLASMAVALFSKTPKPGHVKTRLQPPLTPEEATALHWAFTADIWERLQSLPDVATYFYTDLCWDVDRELPGKPEAHLQRGDNLGARMLHCLEDLHSTRYQYIMIVGGDSPSLPLDYLMQGFHMLHECDAVLGPTGDGGYYAVGCRSPQAEMFRDVNWSTSHTFDDTQAAFRRVGFRVQLMPPWYDVDTPSDLQQLMAEPQLPHYTQACINAYFPSIALPMPLPTKTTSQKTCVVLTQSKALQQTFKRARSHRPS